MDDKIPDNILYGTLILLSMLTGEPNDVYIVCFIISVMLLIDIKWEIKGNSE